MKIGIYGGTFDPVHNGHTFLVNFLLENAFCDKIIITVAGDPPHKSDITSNQYDRLNMAKLAFSGCNAEVSDYEIKSGEKSYTYNTMNYFKELYPDDEVYFITGADAFFDLPDWYNGKNLIKENKFIAVDRSGLFKSKQYFEKYERVVNEYNCDSIIVDVKTPDISSTKLRAMLKSGEDCKDYIPDAVYKYIIKNYLYR